MKITVIRILFKGIHILKYSSHICNDNLHIEFTFGSDPLMFTKISDFGLWSVVKNNSHTRSEFEQSIVSSTFEDLKVKQNRNDQTQK